MSMTQEMNFKNFCFSLRRNLVIVSSSDGLLLCQLTCTHLLSGDAGLRQQRWSCADPAAEIRPWRSRCHSGSRGGSEPVVGGKEGVGPQEFNAAPASPLYFFFFTWCWTHWFVFDGGAGDTQVELAVLLHAGFYQGLNGGLLLEQQEGVAWGATWHHVRVTQHWLTHCSFPAQHVPLDEPTCQG